MKCKSGAVLDVVCWTASMAALDFFVGKDADCKVKRGCR